MTIADEQAEFNAVNAANGEPTQPLETTDDAPYGRRADGTPRAKPGRKSSGTPSSPRRTTPRTSGTRRKTTVDYRPGIVGMLQIPAFALGAAGQLNPALALDGAAISLHAPNIAEALNELANENPTVAAALDTILQAGPYGAIIGACLPLAFQLAANHKAIPDGLARSVGAMPAGEFESMLLSQRKA